MNKDTIEDSNPSGALTVGQLKDLVREEIEAAMGQNGHKRVDSGRPSETSRPFLSVKEAAEMTRLAVSTIRLYIRKGELKAHKAGRRVIIKRTDLEGFLESRPIGISSDLINFT